MNIFEKLSAIQNEVKVTKDNKNSFAGYNYRSAEQIYNAVKPICKKYGAVLHITDEIVVLADRPYIKAVAELIDIEATGDVYAISSVGWARIPDAQRGLSESQQTGSAASYADKYAVSKLMLLDDNKDQDSLPPADHEQNAPDEKWRMSNDTLYIKCGDGEFYPITKFAPKQLQNAMALPELADVKDIIAAELQKRGKK